MHLPRERICERIPLTAELGLPAGAVLCVSPRDRPAGLAAAADRSLAPAELVAFRDMKAIEGRRREWLLGRIAAKEAVALHLGERHGLDVPTAGVVVAPDARGKPHASGDWMRSVPRGVSISIAHSKGLVAAVAWGGEHGPAGLDLERERRLSDALVERAFSAEELALAGGTQGALALWCLKEAAAKAAGRGIFASLADVRVESLTRLRGTGETYAAALLRHGDAQIAIARIL